MRKTSAIHENVICYKSLDCICSLAAAYKFGLQRTICFGPQLCFRFYYLNFTSFNLAEILPSTLDYCERPSFAESLTFDGQIMLSAGIYRSAYVYSFIHVFFRVHNEKKRRYFSKTLSHSFFTLSPLLIYWPRSHCYIIKLMYECITRTSDV